MEITSQTLTGALGHEEYYVLQMELLNEKNIWLCLLYLITVKILH